MTDCDYGAVYRLTTKRGSTCQLRIMNKSIIEKIWKMCKKKHAQGRENSNYFQNSENNENCVAFMRKIRYDPVFDSDIWKNIAERLILYSFSGGAFSFYNIVFF